jgi:hypothetical protein
MQYIPQLDGSYFAVAEDSQYYKTLQNLPREDVATVFLPASNTKVKAYLETLKPATARKSKRK